MRFKLGATFALDVVSQSPAPDAAPAAKVDPEITFGGIDGDVLSLSVPASDPNAVNKPSEIRAYLVAHDQERLADADAYAASALPFGTITVSDEEFAAGVVAKITLPAVLRDVPYFGQVVECYSTE